MSAETGVRSVELNGFGQFEHDGFQIIRSLISASECDQLSAELTLLFQQQLHTAKSRIGGVRNLLRTNPLVAQFAKSPALLELLRKAAGSPVFPVRSIFFDKNPDANWLVPWHQDLAIAVAEQIETPGFSGWSMKDGNPHVHPPSEILAGMITLRLHLDDCDASNGALKVIAGSHRSGKISASEIAEWTTVNKQIVCEVPKGGALLMRPLLLHASSPAETPRHRRVLHIEYTVQKLPNGLEWLDN
jgi:ectoine hydroxylase-related dioxygenase (phytanoyl-CoA dioxygenase family)